MLPIGSIDLSSLMSNPERLQAAGASATGTNAATNAASAEADGFVSQALGAAAGIASSTAAAATASAPAISGAAPTLGGTFPASDASSGSFSNLLENAVSEVNGKMQAADAAKTSLLTGETSNVHQAMIAVQEANVAFSLMVEVRNKLVDSYQELMRMQV
jgi:flagellar hook-basal body complex protein FliE